MTKMTDRRLSDRPREKLAAKGPQSLTNLELLMAIIGSGNAQADVSKIARTVLKLLEQHGREITLEQLMKVSGMGSAKCTEIIAAFTLAERFSSLNSAAIIDAPEKAVNLLHAIRDKQQEYFMLITLDGGNKLINVHEITRGTLTSSLVHPREVFAPAIEDRAASVIVAHNHPSGNLDASQADRQVTARIKEAGELLGIVLLEHVIVTKDSFATIKCL